MAAVNADGGEYHHGQDDYERGVGRRDFLGVPIGCIYR